MAVKFCPIASGSNGNSVYLGTESTHILIDAGFSGSRIEKGLASIGVEGKQLKAIFVTHEHSDHVKGVGVLSRRYNIPVFATERTWLVIEKNNLIGDILPTNKNIIKYDNEYQIDDLYVKPFEILHDAAEPAGYCIRTQKYKISIATDFGEPTDILRKNIMNSDILLIESNHDIEMLKKGSYPWALKSRILGQHGHLSNVGCGTLISEIMNSKLKHIYLGHLSEDNNCPFIAMETVRNILIANKINPDTDTNIYVAQRGVIGDALCLH